MDLLRLLKLKIRERAAEKVKLELSDPNYEYVLEEEVEKQNALVVSKLMSLLIDDAVDYAAPSTTPKKKLEPTSEVLLRAERLQRLALHSPSAEESNAAWLAFSKLWNTYDLPNGLGIKK